MWILQIKAAVPQVAPPVVIRVCGVAVNFRTRGLVRTDCRFRVFIPAELHIGVNGHNSNFRMRPMILALNLIIQVSLRPPRPRICPRSQPDPNWLGTAAPAV